METHIVQLHPENLEYWRPSVVQIFRDVFSLPPYNDPPQAADNFDKNLPSIVQRPVFRCFAVMNTENNHMLGFIYGYDASLFKDTWHTMITNVLNPTDTERWLGHAYCIDQFAILPEAQNMGLGGKLHNRLFSGLTHRTALLSTLTEGNPAYPFYIKRKWQLLAPLPFGDAPYYLLGLELPSHS